MQSIPPLTKPVPYQVRVAQRYPAAQRTFEIDDAYVNEVAESELFKSLFEKANRPFLVKAVFTEMLGYLRGPEFRVFRRYSPYHTLVGAITFFQEADLKRPAEVVRLELLIHLVIYTAGTEGAERPQNYINHLLRDLPSSPHDKQLREVVRRFNFEVKKNDLTQQIIEEMKKRTAEKTDLQIPTAPEETK